MIIFYGTNIRDNFQILMDIHVIKTFQRRNTSQQSLCKA